MTGIGSVVFRDEESIISSVKNEDPHHFYRRVIAPYKGELEMWYQRKQSFTTDLKLIMLTAISVFFPKNKLYLSWFRDLPIRSF